MFVKKYEPKAIGDIVAREKLLAPIIKSIEENSEIPHLMLIGPPGQGKTLTAKCIRRALFGDAEPPGMWYELNASDDNGIDVVREKISNWAKLARPKVGGKKLHRIIFLDEFDNVTPQAQACLRRKMEDYQDSCRFIIAANFSEKIIPALYSRCQVYSFRPIPPGPVAAYLSWVAEQEGAKVPKDMLKKLAENAKGDMRAALNMLEQFVNGGELAVKDPRPLFSRSLGDIAKLSCAQDASLIFSWMHEELLKLGSEGKRIDNAIVALSEYESRSARAILKACHVQAGWIMIKRALNAS